MKPTPWYRVPEAWLILVLLAGGVFAGLSLLVVAERLPDAHAALIHNAPKMPIGH